jgi:hypothetical protein
MNQYLGWTCGMCIMPMVFWLVRGIRNSHVLLNPTPLNYVSHFFLRLGLVFADHNTALRYFPVFPKVNIYANKISQLCSFMYAILLIIYSHPTRYMLESPRWLANKGHFKRCAETLAQIAKINGKNVEYTEKSLKELMKNNTIESVYGMASLFTHWRLAKNTALIVICW